MAITVRPGFTREEVALALRDPGMPLEALRYPVTPIGMDCVLVDSDVPEIDAAVYELRVDGRVRAPLVLALEGLRFAACGFDVGDDGVRRLWTRAPRPAVVGLWPGCLATGAPGWRSR